VEDEEEHATVEWASEGEHEEDEEASASEAGESERTHESVGADGDEELSVPQAFQENDDDDPAKGAQGGERESVVYWYSI
jgi:hypothetical protein